MTDALELLTQKQQVHFTADKDEEVISVLWSILWFRLSCGKSCSDCLFVCLFVCLEPQD